MSVINSLEAKPAFQVLAALSAEEAAKLIFQMHERGYEHYDTTHGHWPDDDRPYSRLGMTLFFRRRQINEEPLAQGRGGHRGARPEGAKKS